MRRSMFWHEVSSPVRFFIRLGYASSFTIVIATTFLIFKSSKIVENSILNANAQNITYEQAVLMLRMTLSVSGIIALISGLMVSIFQSRFGAIVQLILCFFIATSMTSLFSFLLLVLAIFGVIGTFKFNSLWNESKRENELEDDWLGN